MKIGTKLKFPEGNTILYWQDISAGCGLKSGTVFEVQSIRRKGVWLKYPGYGGNHYGDGRIFISFKLNNTTLDQLEEYGRIDKIPHWIREWLKIYSSPQGYRHVCWYLNNNEFDEIVASSGRTRHKVIVDGITIWQEEHPDLRVASEEQCELELLASDNSCDGSCDEFLPYKRCNRCYARQALNEVYVIRQDALREIRKRKEKDSD